MHPLSEPCGRRTKRNEGRPCTRLVVGGGPCFLHGGKAPQVEAKRLARIAAWEAAQRDGGEVVERDPAEALMAAVRESDAMAQRLRNALAARGSLEPALVQALGDWLDRVGRLSSVVVGARMEARHLELQAARQSVVNVFTDQLEGLFRIFAAELGHAWGERVVEAADAALAAVEAGRLGESTVWPVREPGAVPALEASGGDVQVEGPNGHVVVEGELL